MYILIAGLATREGEVGGLGWGGGGGSLAGTLGTPNLGELAVDHHSLGALGDLIYDLVNLAWVLELATGHLLCAFDVAVKKVLQVWGRTPTCEGLCGVCLSSFLGGAVRPMLLSFTSKIVLTPSLTSMIKVLGSLLQHSIFLRC